jgi:hypothetical protein
LGKQKWCQHEQAQHCSTCGVVEDDVHLFFHCDLPQAVWFSFTPSMRTDNLPQESDDILLGLLDRLAVDRVGRSLAFGINQVEHHSAQTREGEGEGEGELRHRPVDLEELEAIMASCPDSRGPEVVQAGGGVSVAIWLRR